VDVITAVAVGTIMASMLFIAEMADLQSRSIRAITDHTTGEGILSAEETALFRELGGRVLLLHLSGPMSFGAANEMTRRMSLARTFDVLVVDMQDVPTLDVSAALALETIIQRGHDTGQQVVLAGIHKPVARTLVQVGLHLVLKDYDHYLTRQRALERARELVGGQAPA
jgi:SulP family sulfate permease